MKREWSDIVKDICKEENLVYENKQYEGPPPQDPEICENCKYFSTIEEIEAGLCDLKNAEVDLVQKYDSCKLFQGGNEK